MIGAVRCVNSHLTKAVAWLGGCTMPADLDQHGASPTMVMDSLVCYSARPDRLLVRTILAARLQRHSRRMVGAANGGPAFDHTLGLKATVAICLAVGIRYVGSCYACFER